MMHKTDKKEEQNAKMSNKQNVAVRFVRLSSLIKKYITFPRELFSPFLNQGKPQFLTTFGTIAS